jgi:hypothetical protein
VICFRVLDPRLRIHGLDDISTPAEQFAALDLPARRFDRLGKRVRLGQERIGMGHVARTVAGLFCR